MNINSQERQALFTSKLIEGKDELTARNEILRDLKFINDFNSKKRELERIIKALEKEISKRIIKNEKLKLEGQKRFKQAFKHDAEKLMNFGSNGGTQYANTVILTRVLHYLESNPSNLKRIEQISNCLCISKFQAEDALRFINKWIR